MPITSKFFKFTAVLLSLALLFSVIPLDVFGCEVQSRDIAEVNEPEPSYDVVELYIIFLEIRADVKSGGACILEGDFKYANGAGVPNTTSFANYTSAGMNVMTFPCLQRCKRWKSG